MNAGWTPDSWRNCPIRQVPSYPDEAKLAAMEAAPDALSAAGFCRRGAAAEGAAGPAADGQAFVLQGGDCAESFGDFTANVIRDTFRVLLQMAVVLTFGGAVPVVKLGRMAGQFAKPRSLRHRDDRRRHPALLSRRHRQRRRNSPPRRALPDPTRMEFGYFQSAGTLNLLRAFASGGYADLHEVHRWNLEFVERSPLAERYRDLAGRIDETLGFMGACGLPATAPQIRETDFYTSHESLLLPYEQALTRVDSTTGDSMPARRISCGSATAPASRTARMWNSCAASRTRSA